MKHETGHKVPPFEQSERVTLGGSSFMKKSLLITTLLTVVLLCASVVSAQSISVFGGLGSGSLELDGESLESSGLAIQAGILYGVTNDLGIGFMFDRVNASDKGYIMVDAGYGPELLSAKMLATLTGYNGVVHYDLVDSDLKLGVFGGAGLYKLHFKLSATDGVDSLTLKWRTESAFGFVAGGQAKYPLTADLYLTGNATYRSATFEEEIFQGDTYTYPEPLAASGWSFGGGFGYNF